MFQGNLLFSSLDHMKFFRTSRKDDIISIFYMMVHILNDNGFCAGDDDLRELREKIKADPDVKNQFESIKEFKKKISLKDMALHMIDHVEILPIDVHKTHK